MSLWARQLQFPVSGAPTFQLDWKAVERVCRFAGLRSLPSTPALRLKDLLEVVIPARTLKHRRERKEPLSLDESDRLARVARFYELAVKVVWECQGRSRVAHVSY